MKTVVILSTDNLGMTVADMLNPREMKLVGMGDTRQETWNVFSDLEKGELKEEIEGMPIMPADLAVALQPDVLVCRSEYPIPDEVKAKMPWNTWPSAQDS